MARAVGRGVCPRRCPVTRLAVLAFAAGLLLPISLALLAGIAIIGWAALHTDFGAVE